MPALTGRFTLALVLVLAAAPAVADYRLEKRLDLAPGGRFILSSAIGQVSVTGDSTDGAQILLTTTLEQKELEDHCDVRFEQSAGLAKLTIERRGGWLGGVFGGDWFRGQKARIEVHVPRQTAVELTTSGGSIHALSLDGKLDVVSSGGRVEIREVRGEVTVGSSGGGVEIHEVEGPVNAESSGGSVELDRVSGEIRAESSGGGVHVRGAGGRVEASSSGGSVEVSFAAGNGEGGEISSSGGGVQVEVDPGVGLSIDASSSGGSVHCDLPVTVQGRIGRDSLHGRLNGGGASLRLRSSGGGVRLASLSD